MRLGAQLYTVRDYCKNLDDFAETLKKIANIGYKFVQVSGTCEYDPYWLKNELEKNGLKCPLTHYNPDKIKNEPENTIQAHKIFNCKNIGIGYWKLHETGVTEFAENFKKSAEIISKSGLNLCYHNHADEFIKQNGKTFFEQLIEEFTADELKLTIDTFWVQAGGCDPAKIIRDLEGRVPCIHLKDMAHDRVMLEVGSGNMNFDSIFNSCEDTGVEYGFVEQDNCNGKNPFDCLKNSYDYCKSCGLE